MRRLKKGGQCKRPGGVNQPGPLEQAAEGGGLQRLRRRLAGGFTPAWMEPRHPKAAETAASGAEFIRWVNSISNPGGVGGPAKEQLPGRALGSGVAASVEAARRVGSLSWRK
jgi:hypothetical protein